MVGGLALLTLNDAVSKWLADSYPIGEIVALRGALTALPVGLAAWFKGGWAGLKPVRVKNQALRAACFVGSSFLIVTALSLLPLADAVAYNFAGPLFIAALAGPLLGEHVSWRRWAAIWVGFAGILVMVRPSTGAFQAAALVALVATFVAALRDLVTRRISAVEASNLILFYSMAAAAMAGGLSALITPWRLPNAPDLGLFALNAALNGGAHLMMIESYRRAEASLVAPFRYTALVWAVGFGFIIWGDIPDRWLLLGAGIVVASGLYLFRLETRGATSKAA